MKILDIQHLDVDGTILWQDSNVYNVMHLDGEEHLLRCAFTGGQNSTVVPEYYYLGLDNRTTVDISDTMADLIGEPLSGSGYQRSAISSTSSFAINFENGHYIATSPIVAFVATTGAWGPVTQLFLTDMSDDTGSLISTATLKSAVSLTAGQSVTMRIGLALKEC